MQTLGRFLSSRFLGTTPTKGRYETTYSEPIAVSVKEAKVISAGDVVRQAKDSSTDHSSRPESIDSAQATKSGNDNTSPTTHSATQPSISYSLSGADLAIVEDRAQLQSGSSNSAAKFNVTAILYGLGALTLAVAFWFRRKRTEDPAARRIREDCKHELDALLQSKTIAELSSSLRRLTAAAPITAHPQLNAVIADCDAIEFAPGGTQTLLDDGLRSRAQSEARTFVANATRASAAKPPPTTQESANGIRPSQRPTK